jgi:uncharacterized protein (DUF488 family)
MHDIVTLGYSHKEAGATLDRLTAQGYHIIDIRLKAASKIPGYNRAELSAKYGAFYHWISALGNRNYNSSSEYVDLKDWASGLEKVRRAHDRAPLLLMCQCRYAEDCHRWLVSRDLQAAIPGLQVTHLLQADHAGMIKHTNARTPGRCAWAINGVACTEETYQRCARCRGDLCDLHAQDIYRWERQTFFCPDCLESYLNEQAQY